MHFMPASACVHFTTMWRFLSSRIVLKRSKDLFSNANRTLSRFYAFKQRKNVGFSKYFVGSVAAATGITCGLWCASSSREMFTFQKAGCEETLQTEQPKDHITLYQYASCPFCNKVRAFLDYYGLDYTIVEVDPLFKKEIKFSEYKKVPIVILQGTQLNDSSLIISLLRSYLLKQDSLEQLLKYYPPIKGQDANGKEIIEYGNRYGIMYKTAFDEERHEKIKKERKWRKWVDDVFIHTLSPNIYRTWAEAMQASNYFSDVGDFSATQRLLAKYFGAIIMYYVGRKMKKKYKLKDDVRESMYDEARKFTKELGKRKFLGGKQPNLADLAMFGVLRGIEGLDAVHDLKQHTDIAPWFNRMKHCVNTHEGAAALLTNK